jgi:hypothetical protein
MKVPELTKSKKYRKYMQLLHYLRGAGCLNTAEIYLFKKNLFSTQALIFSSESDIFQQHRTKSGVSIDVKIY